MIIFVQLDSLSRNFTSFRCRNGFWWHT